MLFCQKDGEGLRLPIKSYSVSISFKKSIWKSFASWKPKKSARYFSKR